MSFERLVIREPATGTANIPLHRPCSDRIAVAVALEDGLHVLELATPSDMRSSPFMTFHMPLAAESRWLAMLPPLPLELAFAPVPGAVGAVGIETQRASSASSR
jgi:hypothetical protein